MASSHSHPREWISARTAIREQEQQLHSDSGIPVSVYGSGSQGYNLLSSCLESGEYHTQGTTLTADDIWQAGGQQSQMLRKQLHEYWTFLMVADWLLNDYQYTSDETVFYQPAQGSDTQHSALVTPDRAVFVEPCLTGYDDSRIDTQWQSSLELLQTRKRRNVRPDLLVTETASSPIPWGSWLYRAAGLAAEQPQEAQWRQFASGVEFIFECKHTTPTRKDLSQTLWYALAYKVPVALVVQEEVDTTTRRQFQTDVNQLDVPVQLIDGFEIGQPTRCRKLICDIFD